MKKLFVLSLFFFLVSLNAESPKATGLVFAVNDKEVKTIDGKDLAKDPVQTMVSLVEGDKDSTTYKVAKTLIDENGNPTAIGDTVVKVYNSRELAIAAKEDTFGFFLKDKKSFVIVAETHWGKSAILYRERKDGHLDSQTVTDWKKLIDINPVNPENLKAGPDGGKHQRQPAVEVEKKP